MTFPACTRRPPPGDSRSVKRQNGKQKGPTPYGAGPSLSRLGLFCGGELILTDTAIGAHPIFGQILKRDVVMLGGIVDVAADLADVLHGVYSCDEVTNTNAAMVAKICGCGSGNTHIRSIKINQGA